jgi:VWFA-related protein
MRLFSSILFIVALFPAFGFSQQPKATPPVDDTIKISTNLIQIDVSVTGKDGKPVTDLRPDEFEIYENGKRQTLTNFTFFASGTNSERSAQVTKPSKDSIPIPPIKLKQENVRRTYALVVDDLGLNFESVYWVQKALKSFINEQMREGDMVAVIRTGSGIGALQSFTNDKRLLLAAVGRIKWNQMGRGGIGPFAPIEPTMREELAGTRRADGSTRGSGGIAEENESNKKTEEVRADNFSIGTLGSLRYIIRGMRDLPGRKSIVLFSEGFALSGTGNRVMDSMRVVADLANRSSVVFYTIDPRGTLNPSMSFAGDVIQNIIPNNPGSNQVDADRRGPREDSFREQQMGLRFLASETGGLSIINQNFFEKGLLRVVDDMTSYYLLGYEPNESVFDPVKSRFNRLEVRVSRPDVTVRYRSGFFGVTDQTLRKRTEPVLQKVVSALISPFVVNEVNLGLYTVFENNRTNGNLIQALVHIDARDIQFSTVDGNRTASFDLIAMTFGDNGTPVDELVRRYTVKVSEAVYENMLANGFVYTLSVPIKKSGSYQFRVALRDAVTDRVGSASQYIEVPDVKKRLVLSNPILDNFSSAEWQKIKTGGSRNGSARSTLLDATIRQFRRDSIVRYDFAIYNPKLSTKLERQVRLIHDGKVIFEESPTLINTSGVRDLSRIENAGGLDLGSQLKPGSYILQIVVSDKSGSKPKFATQYVEFEVVE